MGGGGLQMWDVVRESEKDIRNCVSPYFVSSCTSAAFFPMEEMNV